MKVSLSVFRDLVIFRYLLNFSVYTGILPSEKQEIFIQQNILKNGFVEFYPNYIHFLCVHGNVIL